MPISSTFLSTLTPNLTPLLKPLRKILTKLLLKSVSKPLIKRTFKALQYTYKVLTTPSPDMKQAITEGKNNDKASEELSGVIDDLLDQLGSRFSAVSEELLAKSECHPVCFSC